MEPAPIVILGAGIAGLTTAYSLLKEARDAGRTPPRVVLFEKESRPGGLAVSLSRDGVVTDLGPHRLHTELPEVKRLLAEVASERLIEVSRESHIYWRRQRLGYPIRPFELLRKIGPFATARLASGAAFAKLGFDGARDGADSFENVMRRQFGAGLWDAMLGPYSAKVWKGDPGAIHGDVARVRVSAGGLGSLVRRLLRRGREQAGQETALKTFKYPKGGLQTLVDILVRRVEELGGEIHCNAPVLAIESTGSGARRRIDRLVAGETGKHVVAAPGAVVSTIPLPHLGRLLGEETSALTGGLQYLALMLVVLVVRRERLSRDNWLYFFDGDAALNRAYEAKNFDPDLAPPGKTVLCCEVTARVESPLWREEEASLCRRVAAEVAATGLFTLDELDASYAHRVRWAYPLYHLAYRDDLRRIFEHLAGWENLLSCGRQGLFNHNNTDHSMSMGMTAAQTITGHPDAPGPAWFDGVLERFAHFRIVD